MKPCYYSLFFTVLMLTQIVSSVLGRTTNFSEWVKSSEFKPCAGNGFTSVQQDSCFVSGLKASSIRENKATLSFFTQGNQVVEFGVCYSANPKPTLKSSKSITSYQGEARNIPPISSPFKINVSGLDTATTYYALAYIKNSKGSIFYSAEISFTTKKSDDFSSLLNGVKKDYYPNGKLMREYYLKNGSINGILKMYSDSGYVVSEQNYTNGKANGTLKVYSRNGNIIGETNWINGESGGQTKEYFESGSLKSESNCSGDLQKLSCQIKTYYEKGQLKSEIISSNGEFVQSISYDQQGRVGCKETPGNSICYRYDEDGTVHVIINGVEQK